AIVHPAQPLPGKTRNLPRSPRRKGGLLVQHEYWKTAYHGIDERDFPQVDEASTPFPEEIAIAYAVCSEDCGTCQFIVDGSTQVCEHCGRGMFRTSVRRYALADAAEHD